MKGKKFLRRSLTTGAVFIVALAMTAPAMGETKIYSLYRMTGKITVIDSIYHTVVIDVPFANGQTFVVGGPLASNASLNNRGMPGQLSGFRVGQQVVVEWSPIHQGHLIRMLEAK
jgi:hypothetical protein